MTDVPCTNCGTSTPSSQWWGLSNYYGLTGHFCPTCYDLVSHDPYGKPTNPEAYQAALEKQTLTKISRRLKK